MKLWICLVCSLKLLLAPLYAQQVMPVRSDDFIDYMGIGASFGNDFGVYDELVYSGLDELGIRYIRGWINWLNTGVIGVNEFRDLGIRMCGLWQDPRLKRPLECRPLLKTYGPDFFIAIEGHNEPDIFSRERCYEGVCNDTRNGIYDASVKQHNTLFEDLKSDPETADIPVVAPSFARTRQIKSAVGLKHDLRNLHYYPVWGENSYPTAGYGWESTSWEEVLMNVDDYGSDAGIFFTESGSGIHQLSERAQAKYIGRMYAEYFGQVSGIEKFFYFRLQQQFNTGSGHEEWGLVDTLGNKLYAFHALKSLIDLLKEASYSKQAGKWMLPNEDFIPQPLTVSYTGKLSTTHDLLLQKGNGRYYLLLWQEVNSYLAAGKEDLEPPNDEVTIKISEGIKNVRQFSYTSIFRLESTMLNVSNGNEVSVQVPDHITIIQFDSGSDPKVVAGFEGLSSGEISIYPNPTSGQVHIRTNSDAVKNASVVIIDLTGQVVEEFTIHNGTVDLSNQQPGLYYLKVMTNDGLTVRPIFFNPDH